MYFLNPWMLLGTLGIAVPIVIHLLNRYRYRQIEWGAMELLRRALVVRSRRLRLEDALLLTLRCLAILLLVLALARPTWTARSPVGSGDVGVVLAVDVSFSTGHRPGQVSRLQRALDRARAVASTLQTGQPTSVVLLGDRPRILLRNVGHDPARFEELLEEVKPLPEGLSLEHSLEMLTTLTAEMKVANRECYVISDGQSTTWKEPSSRIRELLDNLAASTPTYLLAVSDDRTENTAITRFRRLSGLVRPESSVRYLAEVYHPGKQPRTGVTVTLHINDKPVDQRVLQKLDPGTRHPVILFARFDQEGIHRLRITLDDDALPVDNVRHAVADVRKQVRALQAHGPRPFEPQAPPDYVRAALAPHPAGPVKVDTLSSLELADQRLEEYAIVLLDNVPDLPPKVAERVRAFVEAGGGMIVVPGDNIQPVVLNAVFRKQGKSLLPGVLGNRREKQTGWLLEPTNHPLAGVVRALSADTVQKALVYRHFPIQLDTTGRAVLKLAGSGEPLLVEKAVGHGRVVLFGFAANPQWTNTVVEPGLYPLLLHEAIIYLCRPAHERSIVVSAPLHLPLRPVAGETSTEAVTVRPPVGGTYSLPTTLREGRRLVELEHMEQPGFYEIQRPEGTPVQVAVNVQQRESDVTTLTVEELEQELANTKLEVVSENVSLPSLIRTRRVGREWWKELLVLAVLVLLLESFLAQRFTALPYRERKMH